jgi:glycosyltransferase involved in cell wall biosynthesis
MQNLKPKISITVLSYNGGKRIIPTLESCKLQIYKDKELIISDDASSDGITPKIIEDWLSENEYFFKRVVFLKNQANTGIVTNSRSAAILATGDVIFPIGQGDLIYGPETTERISDEIERQRSYGLKDPYLWLGHFKSFTMKHGTKINFYRHCSTKNDLDLIEKYPEKALEKMIHRNFIGGPSFIHNSQYFADDIFPLPETINNINDYSCTLWNIINKHRIGIIRQFIRWYEIGIGICSRPNNKMNEDQKAMITWLKTLYPDFGVRKQEYEVNCKNHWQRMTRHPLIFTNDVLKYIVRKSTEALPFEQKWMTDVAKESSPPFEEKIFSPQYYPDEYNGIF